MPRRMTVTLRGEALYTAVRAEAVRRHRSVSEWMQDADPVYAFSGGRARSSVLGVRPSALIRSRVPGARYPEPGTRYLAPLHYPRP
jgi:hypothetical protein